MECETSPPQALSCPQIRLRGAVDQAMLGDFLEQLAAVEVAEAPLVVELMTTGGDAEVGRRIAGEIRRLCASGRQALFYGRTVVYSAGVTIMSGFPRAARWLDEDAMLLIHGRRLEKRLSLQGPIASERVKVEALLKEIDAGLRLQARDFEQLIAGSDVSLSDLLGRADAGWYVTADEALARGLVAGVRRAGTA